MTTGEQPALCGGPTPLGGTRRPCTRPAGHPGYFRQCQVTDPGQLTGEPELAAILPAMMDEIEGPQPAKYTRRFQLLPMIAVCDHHPPLPVPPTCLWSFEGEDQAQIEAEAGGHIDATGHQVRVVSPSMVIMGPPPPAPAAAPAEPVDVAEVPAP